MQTGAAKLRIDRITNLYMVTLLDCVSAEGEVGRMLQNWHVALLATVFKCRVKRGFDYSTASR